jgi:hypothetical protein
MALSRRRFLTLSAAGTAAMATRPLVGWTGPVSQAGWASGPALPWTTQEVYGTTWNGRIVLAGGLRSRATTNRAFTTLAGTALYDPAAEAWATGPDLPDPRHHIVLSAAGGMVYGFGGFVGESLSDGFQFRDDVYAFNGDRWVQMGTMPTRLGETVARTVGGRIHLATGSLHTSGGPQGATGTHLVYDPSADAWTEARPAPTARSSATGGVIDGQLYVVGGRRRGAEGLQNLGTLERYDPAADEWTELRPLPQPSGGLAGAALNGRLYCFGGEYFGANGGGVYKQTWAYDPAADTWTERPPMPTPRHGLAAAALNDRIFAMGGNTAPAVGAATTDAVEVLAPTPDD